MKFVKAHISLILKCLGFLCAFAAYSLHQVLWESAFYHLISFAFLFYTLNLYILSKGSDSLVAFVIFSTVLNSTVDEMFFDPTTVDINEYIGFLMIIAITVMFKGRWLRK